MFQMTRSDLLNHFNENIHFHMELMFLEMGNIRENKNREISELRSEINSMANQLKEVEASGKKFLEAIVCVSAELDSTKTELAQTKSELTDTRERLAATEKKLIGISSKEAKGIRFNSLFPRNFLFVNTIRHVHQNLKVSTGQNFDR